MQDQLWRTKEVADSGYSVVEILDEIGAAKTAGELIWIDWNQPLRLDIQIVEQYTKSYCCMKQRKMDPRRGCESPQVHHKEV